MVKQANWQVTLARVGRISRWCYRLRWLWFGAVLVAIVWFGVLFASDAGSAELLLPLSALLWAGLGLCAGYWLAWSPVPVNSSEKWLRKFRNILINIVYLLLILVMLSLAAGAIMLTFRSISLAMG
jgi:hypothetical protein